jgi:divalent metal cation (Fe/Co/Zn/Cd) transporter
VTVHSFRIRWNEKNIFMQVHIFPENKM